jgi:hypothetical protein
VRKIVFMGCVMVVFLDTDSGVEGPFPHIITILFFDYVVRS